MKRNVHIGIRVPADFKEKLQKLADSQHRSLSNFIELALMEIVQKETSKSKPAKD